MFFEGVIFISTWLSQQSRICY